MFLIKIEFMNKMISIWTSVHWPKPQYYIIYISFHTYVKVHFLFYSITNPSPSVTIFRRSDISFIPRDKRFVFITFVLIPAARGPFGRGTRGTDAGTVFIPAGRRGTFPRTHARVPRGGTGGFRTSGLQKVSGTWSGNRGTNWSGWLLWIILLLGLFTLWGRF